MNANKTVTMCKNIILQMADMVKSRNENKRHAPSLEIFEKQLSRSNNFEKETDNLLHIKELQVITSDGGLF